MSGKRTTSFRPPTREAARIIRAVRRLGGEVELSANNHLLVIGPDGSRALVASHLNGPRSFRNAVTLIRRQTGMRLGLSPA